MPCSLHVQRLPPTDIMSLSNPCAKMRFLFCQNPMTRQDATTILPRSLLELVCLVSNSSIRVNACNTYVYVLHVPPVRATGQSAICAKNSRQSHTVEPPTTSCMHKQLGGTSLLPHTHTHFQHASIQKSCRTIGAHNCPPTNKTPCASRIPRRRQHQIPSRREARSRFPPAHPCNNSKR
jgi:hypothetical protein